MTPDVEKIFIYWLNEVERGGDESWDIYITKYPTLEKELKTYFETYTQLNESFFEGFSELVPDLQQYEIIEKIGEGGMGAVYKASDTNLNRMVAIKTSLPLKGSDELQEARSMARLHHQNIVQVFDLIKYEYKNYIVMELINGEPLDKKTKSLDYQQIANIFYQLCDALEYAHEKGIMHRDLKPQNILITENLIPKIVDFGLAEDLDQTSFDEKGSIKGTPVFTAPEIISGKNIYTSNIDIYSLGICLYITLTGKQPFEYNNIEELLQKVNNYQFDFPNSLNPDIPEPLQVITLKAMDAKAKSRYQSAREMKEDLHKYLSKEPVTTRPAIYQLQLNELISAHQVEINEWEKKSFITPDEKETLTSRYDFLLAKEDDWILENRQLSFSQNSLYLGVWLSVIGSLLMFYALFYPHTNIEKAESNIFAPLSILTITSICGAAGFFFWNERKFRIGLSFLLVFIYTLPLAFLSFFKEFNWFHNPTQLEYELFNETLWLSNLQLFQSFFFASIASFYVNLKIKTRGTSFAFGTNVFLCFIFGLILFGLKEKLLNENMVWFGSWLLMFALISFGIALKDETKKAFCLSEPFYWLSLLCFLTGLIAWSYQGELLHSLQFSFASYYPNLEENKIKTLHQCLSLTLIAPICLFTSKVLEKLATTFCFRIGRLLSFSVPYFFLLPIAFLTKGFEYGFFFDLIHILASIGIVYTSIWLQKKNYYYSGLLNIATFLFIYGTDYELLNKFSWTGSIVIIGILFLSLGAIPLSKMKNKIKSIQ